MSEQRLGILGGMGPQATQDFYQRILDRTDASCDQEHLPTLIWSDTSMPDRTAAILGGDAEGCYRRLLDGARLLERGGCTALAIPCNTSHYFADRLQGDIAIPLIHMPRETVAVLAADGKKRVGILATDGTVQTGIYQRECAARRQTKQGPADAFASAGPCPIFRSSVLGHHRKEFQRLCPVVDQGVGVSLRAVMAVPRGQALLAAAIQGLACAGENVHNFAAPLVGVQADGAPRLQPPPHDAVAPVRKHPGVGHSLAALEPGDGGLLHGSEFHLHSNSSSDYSSDTPNRPAISRRPSSSSSRPKPAASSWASVRSLSRA